MEAHSLTLAGLITELAGDRKILDRDFARALAAALQGRADQLSMPDIEAMDLSDIMVTFSMDEEMTVVITGTPRCGVGDAIVRYADDELDRVPILLHPEARPGAYTFCTLDFSARGQTLVLPSAQGPYGAGEEVTVRAHATIGGRPEIRVTGPEGQLTLSPEDVVDPG